MQVHDRSVLTKRSLRSLDLLRVVFLDINILLSLYLSEFYPFSLRDFGIEATCRRLLSPHSPRLFYSGSVEIHRRIQNVAHILLFDTAAVFPHMTENGTYMVAQEGHF